MDQGAQAGPVTGRTRDARAPPQGRTAHGVAAAAIAGSHMSSFRMTATFIRRVRRPCVAVKCCDVSPFGYSSLALYSA
jgi:hypothetical protein